MYVKVEHVKILRCIRDCADMARLRKLGIGHGVVSRRVTELRIMGLVRVSEGSVGLTPAGRLLTEATDVIGDVSELPDPWLNSPVIEALKLAVDTNYVLREWVDLLKSRRLYDGRVTEVGRKVLQAYSTARPSIFITPEIAEFLVGLPPGPSLLDELISYRDAGGFGSNVVNALEAMRLLKISPPTKAGSSYTLTEAGRIVRKALLRIPLYDSVISINERVMEILRKDSSSLTDSEQRELELMHLTNSENREDFMAGYERQGLVRELSPPFTITMYELSIISVIQDILGKGLLPTYDEIARRVGRDKRLGSGEALHMLEAKDLLRRIEREGHDTYEPTEYGREVVRRLSGIREDITSDAVKPVTYALSGIPPKPEWVIKGRALGIVFNDVTSRGEFLMRLSKSISRKPFLTRYDAMAIHLTPKKGMPLHELVDAVSRRMEGFGKELFNLLLSEAEAKGFINVLPNDYVKLTSLGEGIKEVITYASTNEILKSSISITPTNYNVLRTIAEYEDDFRRLQYKKDYNIVLREEVALIYNNIKKYTSITLKEIRKSIQQLRVYGLLGKAGLTAAGRKLLEIYAVYLGQGS